MLCLVLLSAPFPDLSQCGSRVRAEGPVKHQGMSGASNSRVLVEQNSNFNNDKGAGMVMRLYLQLSYNYF